MHYFAKILPVHCKNPTVKIKENRPRRGRFFLDWDLLKDEEISVFALYKQYLSYLGCKLYMSLKSGGDAILDVYAGRL